MLSDGAFRTFATVLLSFLLVSVISAAQPLDTLSKLSESLTNLTRQVAPAVVEVELTGYLPDDDDSANTRYAKQQVIGSGVILSPDGYIVTNAHVVRGAKNVRVTFSPALTASSSEVLNGGNGQYEAAVVGVDVDTDLAFLKINARDLPTLRFAPYSEIRQGQIVVAVGNPVGLQNSVSVGVVSAVSRESFDGKPEVLIQTDAAINPGSSGGALVDTDGRLVGITCEVWDGERLGFAVPSDMVRFVYEQVRTTGRIRHGEISAEFQNINSMIARGLSLPRRWGVIVREVKLGSPADTVGLRPSDVILSVDGKAVANTSELKTAVYFKTATETVTLAIYRAGEKITLQVPVVDRVVPALSDSAMTLNPERNLVTVLGILAADASTASQAKDDFRRSSGVMVSGRISGTPIHQYDLNVGDVIHSVNGKSVADVEGLRSTLDKIKPGEPIVLWVDRNGKHLYLALESY
jgi:serine protease Do